MSDLRAAVAAGAVIDLLREVELLLETLGATPVPELRSGGLGVREVKRLTKITGIDESGEDYLYRAEWFSTNLKRRSTRCPSA